MLAASQQRQCGLHAFVTPGSLLRPSSAKAGETACPQRVIACPRAALVAPDDCCSIVREVAGQRRQNHAGIVEPGERFAHRFDAPGAQIATMAKAPEARRRVDALGPRTKAASFRNSRVGTSELRQHGM